MLRGLFWRMRLCRPCGRPRRLRQFLRRPKARSRVRATIQHLIAADDLDGTVGVVLADAGTGEVLEAVEGEVAVPPASVTKAVTALYALDALGGAFLFITRFFAFGSAQDGILDGDLILAGGGGPTL